MAPYVASAPLAVRAAAAAATTTTTAATTAVATAIEEGIAFKPWGDCIKMIDAVACTNEAIRKEANRTSALLAAFVLAIIPVLLLCVMVWCIYAGSMRSRVGPVKEHDPLMAPDYNMAMPAGYEGYPTMPAWYGSSTLNDEAAAMQEQQQQQQQQLLQQQQQQQPPPPSEPPAPTPAPTPGAPLDNGDVHFNGWQ